MTPLECKVMAPQGAEGAEPVGLTVGEVFQLSCKGERPVFAEIELQLALPEDKTHALKILKSQFPSESEMLLDVASYTAGQHDLQEIFLVSGNDYVPINPISFSVESVIDPSSPPTEPFPAKGPLLTGTPVWYYMAVALPIILIVLLLAAKAFFFFSRRELVEKIKAYRPGGGGYQYFNKELRQLQRKYTFLGTDEIHDQQVAREYLDHLSNSFVQFLEWHFLIPFKGRSPKAYLKELRKKLSRGEEACFEPIRKALVELARARREQSITALDCRQLLEVTRIAANTAQRRYQIKESA